MKSIIWGLVGLCSLGNTSSAEEAIEEFINFPRSEIKKTLHPLLYEATARIRSSSDLDEAIKKHLSTLPPEIGQQFNTDTLVTVRDEEGNPVPNARVYLEQTGDGAGGEIYDWNRRFQSTKTTNAQGQVLFHQVPYYNFFLLARAIGLANKWPYGNLDIRVSKDGFVPAHLNFVGINKVGVAMALEWHSIIRKFRKIDRAQQHRKPDPPINPHFVFPDINMYEHIELEFILKKDVSQTTQAQK